MQYHHQLRNSRSLLHKFRHRQFIRRTLDNHSRLPYPPQQSIYPQMQPMQPMPAPKQKKRRTKQKPSPEQARLTKLAWIAIWLAFLLLVYCIASDLFRYFEMDGQTPTLQQSQSSTLNIQYQERPVSDAITQPDENGAYTVAGVAEAVAPSIVEITAASGSMPTSSGSGIILSEDGYIVTNAHVIYDSEYGKIAIRSGLH